MNGSTINASSMNIRAPTSSPATAPAPQTVQAHEPREYYPEDGCTDYRNSTCPHGERVRFESWNSWSDGSLHLQEYGDRALMGTVSKDQYAKYVCEVYWDNGEIELHMVGTLCRLEYRITLEDIVFTVLVLVCECISFGGFLMHASECDNSTVFCFCINIVATVGLTVGKLFPPRTRYSNCISVRCQNFFITRYARSYLCLSTFFIWFWHHLLVKLVSWSSKTFPFWLILSTSGGLPPFSQKGEDLTRVYLGIMIMVKSF